MYSKLEYGMQTGVNYASNNIPVMEISTNYVRFAIGSFIDKKPVLSFYEEESIRGAISKGMIVDFDKVKTAIGKVLSRTDEALKLKTDISSINLILPPYGLRVYETGQFTTVMSPSQIVDVMDIENLLGMCKNNRVGEGSRIIDIIPEYYELNNRKRFRKAPIGEKSSTLSIYVKIHSLPDSIAHVYAASLTSLDLQIERMAVSSLCSSSLIAIEESSPSSYILVDIGAHCSTASLIGDKGLFSSDSFFTS